MTIGIITQPLTANYGGILQNWALQQILKRMGHNPVTLDILPEDRSLGTAVKENVLAFLSIFTRGRFGNFVNHYKVRPKVFDKFVKENIATTHVIHKYEADVITRYKMEGLLVGSDQVWRPQYNWGYLSDMFFKFASGLKLVKASYAASFGSDQWEFSTEQTIECCQLIKQFDGISVREKSGLRLCYSFFAKDATLVLDPTLLLSKADYITLIGDTPRICEESFLAAYILDLTPDIQRRVEQKAHQLGLKIVYITADTNASLSVENWLSVFRDADFIFTNSFHGSVFSLIFEKEFEFISHEERGGTRFQVIKDLLENRNIEEQRNVSIDYLKHIYG